MEATKVPREDAVATRRKQEIDETRAPPSPERIREMLGWNLIEAEREGHIE